MTDADRAIAADLLARRLRWVLEESEYLSKETIANVVLDFLNAYQRETGGPQLLIPHLEGDS